MKTKIGLILIATMFVLAMVAAPASAKDEKDKDDKAPTKCADYHFIYDDGHEDEGRHCDGNEVSSQVDPDNKKYADIHVNTLHISCSDKFENGEGQKSDLDGHLVASFLIEKMKYDKKSGEWEVKKSCGPGIDRDPTCEGLGLDAEALDGGSIQLTMNALAGADEYRIWKAAGAGPLALLETVPASTILYVDDDTVVGTSYHYRVQIVVGDEIIDECDVEITAVPVFGSIVASGLAVGLGLLAYVGARRRF